jgi:hypothetical protein
MSVRNKRDRVKVCCKNKLPLILFRAITIGHTFCPTSTSKAWTRCVAIDVARTMGIYSPGSCESCLAPRSSKETGGVTTRCLISVRCWFILFRKLEGLMLSFRLIFTAFSLLLKLFELSSLNAFALNFWSLSRYSIKTTDNWWYWLFFFWLRLSREFFSILLL